MIENTTNDNSAELEPLIPYADPENIPGDLRVKLDSYLSRMGFLPNALKLYMHRPEIAEVLWELNDRVMRDESSVLDQLLKRKCALIASKVNGCQYCTTHHCTIVKRPAVGLDEGWGLEQEEVDALLNQEYGDVDEEQLACLDFVAAASLEPGDVSEDIYLRLKRYLSPEGIVELALLVGFWKMYNTIHDSLRIPVEQSLVAESKLLEM